MKILFIAVLSIFLCSLPSYNFSKWKIREPIDLTWPVDEHSMFWPDSRNFSYTSKRAVFEKGGWYATNDFCIGEHSGTHLDAPYHYNKFGWRVGDIPVQRLIAQAVVIDMSEIVQRLGPTVELQEVDLVDWERKHGPLPQHCVVMVRFGWSDYYQKRDVYLGMNGTDNMVFPGIGADAANWLVKTNKVVGVGVDTASIDSGSSLKFETHRIMAANEIYNLENLNIPERLPARGFNVIVMPMKLKEGSGAPVRVLAIPEIILGNDFGCHTIIFSTNSVHWYGHTSVVLSSLLLLGMYAINFFSL